MRGRAHNAMPKPDLDNIEQLTPDPRNARRRGQRASGMIVSALREVGAARSIVIDEDGRVLAGNGVVEAANEIGLKKMQVIDVDGNTVVAVRRKGLTDEEKTRLALFDNRTAELAEWDENVLKELSDEIDLGEFFNPDELADLFVEDEKPAGDGGDEFDTTPADGPTRCQLGELWQLGEHRLICGDCTDADTVARLLAGEVPNLMVTDPPYGVDYDPNWRNEAADKGLISHAARRVGEVTNDDRADWTEAWKLFPGAVCYCWHAGRHASAVQASIEAAGFEIRNQIVWAKSNFAISRGHYNWKHEPCWYAVRSGKTAAWVGDHSQTTLWEINLDKNVEGGHSTQKPLECMARAIRNHAGDVYDPFCGSGTTLIAAERLGRKCYACEISARYADVILRRWEAESGQEAVKVQDARA